MVTISIAAVGDLLMKSEIIASARHLDEYKFEPIFEKVAPYLRKHDITLGNLETTFSGKRWYEEAIRSRRPCHCPKERRHPKTRYPMFSCPDELAPALKKTGFHLLTTANNHCMDGGKAGLTRTLRILDQHGLQHTGTFRSRKEAKRHTIIRVKGIKIGIVAYTRGTNSLPVRHPWSVNRMDSKKILADIRELKKRTDFIIVCLHFGREYQSAPSKNQKRLIQLLFQQGANAVLGAHPHVLHPISLSKVKDMHGHIRNRVAASSLGNFVSTRLKKDERTIRGKILEMTITKNDQGVTDISRIDSIPTIVQRRIENNRAVYRVIPERK